VTSARLLPVLLLALLAALTPLPSAAAASIIVQPAPYCQPGQAPRFALGFADLAGRLGEPMGQPVECEHVDPVSGDTQQQTTTGLAYYQAASNRTSFTNGWRHWSLIDGRVVTWIGPDAGPPVSADAPGVVDDPAETTVAADAVPIDLPGRIVGRFNVRSAPRIAPETVVRTLDNNAAVQVEAAVRDQHDEIWYQIGEGEYVHSSGVRLPRPPAEVHDGRWIDADLQTPTLVTAYEGDRAVYSALAIPGKEAWETPTGTFQILRRVANETMDSSTIGIPRTSPGGYFLEDVLYTQYFTNDGASLHYNWWKGTFGYPGSHGCLGLDRDDAAWFWEWASIGTTVVIHD
jgi:lipoprotein-anchoring transpeptidase ErfK/SrfK